MKTFLLAATAVAMLAGGAAQAQTYGSSYAGGALPPPPYAYDGRAYVGHERAHHRGFPLLGADAGVTVLGIHLGGSAKIRIGLDQEVYEHHHRPAAAVEAYAPPPPPPAAADYRAEPPCGCW